MKLNNVTIKQILTWTAVIVALILIFIGITTDFQIQRTIREYKLLSDVKDIESYELQLRKDEKDFLVNEPINSEFHMSGRSTYLDEMNQVMGKIQELGESLRQSKTVEEQMLTDKLVETDRLFKQYLKYMYEMSDLIREKGFKDFGLVGDMREQIHAVESAIAESENEHFAVLMLTLRRHEKDYLLRRDLKYRDKFASTIAKFRKTIQEEGTAEEQKLIPLLEKYQDIFNKVIQMDISIGLASDKGLNYNINKTIEQIEDNLVIISSAIEKSTKAKINHTLIQLLITVGVASLLIVFILFSISRHIVRSIVNLRLHIIKLGNGELPDEVTIYNNDEIAHMKESINTLTRNLKNTRDFAEAVGDGNFSKEIDVFGNKGDLGSALVDMRSKLLQVSKEREDVERSTQESLWANEGYNKIHEILSSGNGADHEIYFTIISRLTQYLGANQGTLFIAEESDGEMQLVQKGTYAFDRRKINEKNILFGEGLIGAVAFEKQTTYITDIPEGYINITSGLGDSAPKSLLIVPCISDNELLGIVEIASFNPIADYQIAFVERVASDIANETKKLKIEETTRHLLETTQRQAQELTEKEEEMRQNLEELQTTQETMQQREQHLLKEIDALKAERDKIRSLMGQTVPVN